MYNAHGVDKELMQYIRKKIIPLWKKNDKGHDQHHLNYVIKRSMAFAYQVKPDVDLNMVYTVACYHDCMKWKDAKHHEIVSGDYLLQDKGLKKWFNDKQIKTMAIAVKDHRASLTGDPRNIYGKIVSTADRNITLEDICKRSYKYRNNIAMSDEQKIEEAYNHIIDKYGSNGYAHSKIYFKDIKYEKFKEEILHAEQDKEWFVREFKKFNNIR